MLQNDCTYFSLAFHHSMQPFAVCNMNVFHTSKCIFFVCWYSLCFRREKNEPPAYICRYRHNPKYNCIITLRNFHESDHNVELCKNWIQKQKKKNVRLIRHIHHMLFEFILPALNITRMATFLMFHIFYCFVLCLFFICFAWFPFHDALTT